MSYIRQNSLSVGRAARTAVRRSLQTQAQSVNVAPPFSAELAPGSAAVSSVAGATQTPPWRRHNFGGLDSAESDLSSIFDSENPPSKDDLQKILNAGRLSQNKKSSAKLSHSVAFKKPSPFNVKSSPTAAPSAESHSRPESIAAETTPVRKTFRKFKPRKAAMSLTDSAVSHVRQLLDGPSPKLLRIGVRNRGCSGLQYHLEYVDAPGKFDEEVVQDGVKVLIDSKALFSIIGSEMDWVDDKLSNRFVFKNPNIKGECGCGESFSV
ncbi:uncharacterized protein V1516DRAFT_679258 [Lipomyces oligophaga]|uniref:uncharacterized protein n=1 Tax=Lipomyces oligophaga TaxID=45792 RepID=UPI0034CDD768